LLAAGIRAPPSGQRHTERGISLLKQLLEGQDLIDNPDTYLALKHVSTIAIIAKPKVHNTRVFKEVVP
jgi:hypothetical protein